MTGTEEPVRAVRRPTEIDLTGAWRQIQTSLPPTPLVSGAIGGRSCLLKLETFQPTGSFKIRGALAALADLPGGSRVVTASAGNHALGIAYAAGVLGVDATVVVAETASAAKVAAIRRWPVRLVQYGASFDEAEGHALHVGRAEGWTYVSPYNDPSVIAGQATVGMELGSVVEGPLTVVAGVGGGGLVAGLGLWAQTRPGTRVIGVEAAVSRAVSTAVAAGMVVPVPVGPTLADALAGNIESGSITVDLIRDYVHDLVTVTEDELIAGLRHLAADYGLIAEGAGGAPVAAVLAGKVPGGGPLALVISGRMIALDRYASIIASG